MPKFSEGDKIAPKPEYLTRAGILLISGVVHNDTGSYYKTSYSTGLAGEFPTRIEEIDARYTLWERGTDKPKKEDPPKDMQKFSVGDLVIPKSTEDPLRVSMTDGISNLTKVVKTIPHRIEHYFLTGEDPWPRYVLEWVDSTGVKWRYQLYETTLQESFSLLKSVKSNPDAQIPPSTVSNEAPTTSKENTMTNSTSNALSSSTSEIFDSLKHGSKVAVAHKGTQLAVGVARAMLGDSYPKEFFSTPVGKALEPAIASSLAVFASQIFPFSHAKKVEAVAKLSLEATGRDLTEMVLDKADPILAALHLFGEHMLHEETEPKKD